MQCLSIEVEQNFHVVRNETDWRYDHVGHVTRSVQLAQVITDIGLQPRLRGRTAATLINESPCLLRKGPGHQAAIVGYALPSR